MTTRNDCERFHRRDFLRLGGAGLLGLNLADLLRLEAPLPRSARRRQASSWSGWPAAPRRLTCGT